MKETSYSLLNNGEQAIVVITQRAPMFTLFVLTVCLSPADVRAQRGASPDLPDADSEFTVEL